MSWHQRFGLTKPPFTTDPFESNYTMVNYSQLVQDLVYYTASGNIILLEGIEGTGKTMMLRQVIDRYRGEGKVVYVDGKKLTKSLQIEELLNKKGTHIFGKLMSSKPQNMILLLDDVQKISEKQSEKIKYYFDQNYIRSVIFTTRDASALELSQSLWDRIQARHIRVPSLIGFDAVRIIRERFSDHYFLPDEVVLELFKKSNKNVKQLLINCDLVCKYVVKQGKGEVLSKYIDRALKPVESKPSRSVLDTAPRKMEAS